MPASAKTPWGLSRTVPFNRSSILGALLAAAVVASASGCVERQMVVRSNPPGALVYIDDYEIGTTPVTATFTYYGQRKIRLVKDGYETLTQIVPVAPPWYEYFGVDFVSENFVPGKIRDQHVYDFQLQPQLMVPPEQLRASAESLRRGVQATATPSQRVAPGMRINAPQGPYVPPPTGPEAIPAPQGIGGQQVYPMQPGQ